MIEYPYVYIYIYTHICLFLGKESPKMYSLKVSMLRVHVSVPSVPRTQLPAQPRLQVLHGAGKVNWEILPMDSHILLQRFAGGLLSEG